MSESNSSASIGFPGLLFLVFLVLKLTNVISWSWWWVTAPLWIAFAVTLTILVVAGVLAYLLSH